jgi:hypothetical protein
MDEECYVIQIFFQNNWIDVPGGTYRYTDEQSEARALSLAEAILHESRKLTPMYDHRIVQTKVVVFVPRKD